MTIEIRPTKWDHRFLAMARLVASWSKDPSTKVGAVLADPQNRVVSLGFNGPPRGVLDDETISREIKLKRTLHAEENAFMFANRDTSGLKLYVTHHPCAHCAAVIAQKGVLGIIMPTQDPGYSERWVSDLDESRSILLQAGIPSVVLPC